MKYAVTACLRCSHQAALRHEALLLVQQLLIKAAEVRVAVRRLHNEQVRR